MSVVDVEHLTKTYGHPPWKFWRRGDDTEALKGVNFSVERGEIFGIVGPNGAGKTTLINILSGLVYKDEGSVRIFGDETRENRGQLAKKMNVATAYSMLSGHLTVRENLKVFAKIYDVDDADARIEEALETFEIPELADRKIFHLSAGQKTRANLCKSFINDPELLLLDEVTAGLDPHIADVTREAIKKMNRERGTTIIITSHDMQDIDRLSDRMLFLHNGRVLRIGAPEELKKEIHVKVLEVTIDRHSTDFVRLIEGEGGRVEKNTGLVKIDYEEEIIDILNAVRELDVEIIDIEARNPDLEEVFRKVAREGDMNPRDEVGTEVIQE